MSEDEKKEESPDGDAKEEWPKLGEGEVAVGRIRAMMIQLPTGEQIVRANGPLKNRLLCYAILEGAKDIIREFSTPKPAVKRAGLAEIHNFAKKIKDL